MVTFGPQHPVHHRVDWRSLAPVATSVLVLTAVGVGFVLLLSRGLALVSTMVTGW